MNRWTLWFFFFFQAEDGIRDLIVTGVQTCALPISRRGVRRGLSSSGPVGRAGSSCGWRSRTMPGAPGCTWRVQSRGSGISEPGGSRRSGPPWSTVSPTRSPRCCTGPRSCSTPRCRCSCCRRPPTVGSRCSAERAFARGSWGEARAAYAAAAGLDPTCWICYWRHAEVGRWFDLEDDPRDSARYGAHVADFPVYYRTLIRAERLPLRARLDTLAALSRGWKDFLFGQFRLGDELLHRGPLVGRARREVARPLEAILTLDPAFVPALQHLAWLHIAEGDSGAAALA